MDHHPAVKMRYEVPARLLDLLLGDECDVALLPVIDYQRADDLLMLPASCIGADGPVYTVRLFSRVPIEKIRVMYADVESHTSVALCRILLKRVFGIEPQFVTERRGVDAWLLIGDKVVCAAPSEHPYELDLAEAWKKWTGLPFVFAVWMTRHADRSAKALSILKKAKAEGLQHVDAIVKADALPRKWPADVAKAYLTQLLKFDIDLADGSPQRRAIELFHREAHALGITQRCRPVEVCLGQEGLR